MFCSRCGAQRIAGQRFCAQCGADGGSFEPAMVASASPSWQSEAAEASSARGATVPPAQGGPPQGATQVQGASTRRRGRAGTIVGTVLVAAAAGGAGYVLGSAGGTANASPVSLASLASGDWGCRSDDGSSAAISLDTSPDGGRASVQLTDESHSVKVTQSGDADVAALASGLLAALGEQGSITVQTWQDGWEDSATSLSWQIDEDQIRVGYTDRWGAEWATCTRSAP